MKYLIYGCKEVCIVPPSKLIKCNSSARYKDEVYVDECLEEEIKDLWSKGIKTTGCCCGHGYSLGFIQVTNDCIDKMEKLGYQHYLYVDKLNDGTRMDAFIPKTVIHKTTKLIPYPYDISNNIIM